MRIGISSLAHTHAFGYIELLRGRDGIELLVTDPGHGARPVGEEGGPALAERLGVAYAESLEELLAWRPDAVIVCSENARHLADVEAIAAAGAHVLCEKPIATTVPDARRMVECCERAGVLLMTAFPVRFTHEFDQLRELVGAGVLGRVLSVSGTNNGRVPLDRAWFTDLELAGGGSVADHTVHVADLVFALFPGIEAEEVYATANRTLHPELAAETAGLVSIRYTNGLTAVVDCSWSKPAHYPVWGGLTLKLIAEGGVAELAPFARRVDGYSEARREQLWLSYGQDSNERMLDEFIEAVTLGRQPEPSGEQGLRAVEVVVAAYRSLECGQPVRIADVAAKR